MKFDLKNLVLLLLSISTIVFGLSWYFDGNNYKAEYKKLDDEYNILEAQKKVADGKIAAWKEVYNKRDLEDKRLTKEVINAKIEANIAKERANRSEKTLLDLQTGLKETRNRIEEIQKSGKSLTDDELLKDLIKNTK
jgi:hypothetical protein